MATAIMQLETLNELQAQMLEGLIRPRSARVVQGRALRLRFVLRWAGSLLLTLSGCALAFALSWQMANLILLATAYGGSGLMILLTSRIAAS